MYTVNAYKSLFGKPEGKRPQGRPKSRWEYVRMYLKKTRWEGVDWIYLASERIRTSNGLF
jgi:hypothetical protein